MDNYTIIIVFDLVLVVITGFTLSVTYRMKERWAFDWKVSSVLILMGFLLLAMQRKLPAVLSIIAANYLILLGSILQAEAGLLITGLSQGFRKSYSRILSVCYFLVYPFFTYIYFNTTIRIIVVSGFLTVTFAAAAVLFLQKRTAFRGDTVTGGRGFSWFFITLTLFHLFRSIATAVYMRRIVSLYQNNPFTTITFLSTLFFNLSFAMLMFQTAVRKSSKGLIKERDKLKHLFNFLNDTAKYLELSELYKKIQEILQKTCHFDSGGIYLRSEDQENHVMVFDMKNTFAAGEEIRLMHKGQGVSGMAIDEDRVIEMDISDYKEPLIAESLKQAGFVFLAAAPIKSPEGIIGAITLAYRSRENWEYLDRDFFYFLGEQLGIVLNNALLYRKVTMLASTDQLTGLYNRRRTTEILMEEEKRFRRSGIPFSVGMGDLDSFKIVNDTMGHECGDILLKKAAVIFRETVREIDVVGRWGGEEFLFVFPGTAVKGAGVILERIRSRLEEHLSGVCGNLQVRTISIGVTEFTPEDTLREVIARSDKALYQAKREGKNRVVTVL